MFKAEVETAAKAHAVAEHPRESCGLVIDGSYLPIKNESPTDDEFKMPNSAFTAHGVVQGVIHSHKHQQGKLLLMPSANDMQHQIASDVPWGILSTDGENATPVLWWGDFRLDEPLLGRQFVHGVTDCYGAVRAWHWQQRGVKLIDVPRDDHWWAAKAGDDLYNVFFPRAGFHVIKENEAQVGDLALIKFRSEVINHSGTLVEDGLMYHHLQGRLSCREPIGRWRPLILKWLRHEGK